MIASYSTTTAISLFEYREEINSGELEIGVDFNLTVHNEETIIEVKRVDEDNIAFLLEDGSTVTVGDDHEIRTFDVWAW